MDRKLFLFFITLIFSTSFGYGQSFVKTTDILKNSDNNTNGGHLNINQNYALDTLISRYILANVNLSKENGYFGMEGFRIQIYRSSVRNARDESNKAKQEFLDKFQDINSYILFDNPGWYMVRVGDYRSKTEAMKQYLIISKEFPDAYLVPDIINFPDLNTK